MTPSRPGRKPIPESERRIGRNVYLTEAEWAIVEAIGGGNRQEGVRRMLALWKRKGGKG